MKISAALNHILKADCYAVGAIYNEVKYFVYKENYFRLSTFGFNMVVYLF